MTTLRDNLARNNITRGNLTLENVTRGDTTRDNLTGDTYRGYSIIKGRINSISRIKSRNLNVNN